MLLLHLLAMMKNVGDNKHIILEGNKEEQFSSEKKTVTESVFNRFSIYGNMNGKLTM